MSELKTLETTVTVTLTGTAPNLNWQAVPDPLEVDDENLITYQLVNQTGSLLVFCDVEISPDTGQIQVQTINATQIQLLDQDLAAGSFAVYLWVQDRRGNRYRSPDPQIVNR